MRRLTTRASLERGEHRVGDRVDVAILGVDRRRRPPRCTRPRAPPRGAPARPPDRRRAAAGVGSLPTRAASTAVGACSHTTTPGRAQPRAGCRGRRPCRRRTRSRAGSAPRTRRRRPRAPARGSGPRRRCVRQISSIGMRRVHHDQLVECRRTTRPSRRAHSRADRRLARAHQPDEHEVPRSSPSRRGLIAARRVRVVVAHELGRASRRRTCAAPPTRARARSSSPRPRRPREPR